MDTILLRLYKVKWKHTANTYVVCHSYANKDEIIEQVRESEGRCDDIVDVEEVFLPAFDGDTVRRAGFIRMYVETRIL